MKNAQLGVFLINEKICIRLILNYNALDGEG